MSSPTSLSSLAPQYTMQTPETGELMLPNSGGKPLRMNGFLLAEASSFRAGCYAWHELLFYERDAGDFAIGLKTCRQNMGDSDVFHARIFPTMDAALTWVQMFDPTADLTVDLDASDRRISTADIALRAATLRQRADSVALQFRAMIGELLFRLETNG